MKKNRILTAVGSGLFLGILTLFLWWNFYELPLTSPISSLSTFRFIQQIIPRTHNKLVYGFLPYWNLDEAKLQPELTNLAYFGLTLGGDGKILTSVDGGLEPGFRDLKSEKFLELSAQMTKPNQQVELVLTQFDNDTIVSLLNSEQSTQNLLDSLDAILLSYPVSGVNLDIEYTGRVTPHLQQRMTALVTAISQHLENTYDQVQFSIDMYASATSKEQLWEVAKIAPQVDHIIVMAYDFHQRSSPQAGPVAPLFGGDEYWDSDINQHLADFLQIVPSEKILLGIPFYGYEWQTTSRDSQAHTFPKTGATASFKRVNQIKQQAEELSVEENWNEQALSPYLSYLEEGEIFVIYYEDSRSLSYKLDYVNQLDLGGIAIWALGYEGNSREYWDVISRKI